MFTISKMMNIKASLPAEALSLFALSIIASFSLFFFFRKNRTKKRIWMHLMLSFALYIIFDASWAIVFFENGIYVGSGIISVYCFFLFPLTLLLTSLIQTIYYHKKA